MFKALLRSLILAAGPFVAYAQDSIQVSYSEESDTLVKQRFLDRYEHVFMTKVPTRHMLKIGLSQYYQAVDFPLRDDKILNNTSLKLGYEFKFLPAFSIALAGHMPFFDLNMPLKTLVQYTVMDAQIRWFVGMGKRIRKGLSANNFSGNYVAVFYNLPGTADNYNPKVGLKLGLQRRFLNHGFMDFSVAVFQGAYDGSPSFSSQASLGIAFGDWKQISKAPLCDILLCDAQIMNQWKIRLPEITVGYYMNRLKAGVAFEQKLGAWPLTLNFQLDASMNNGFNLIRYTDMPWNSYGGYMQVYSREKIVSFSVQPRYYILTKRQQMKGRNTNGMSGIYGGINTQYYYYKGKHSDIPPNDLRQEDNIIHAGPLLGFQLRLFNRGYFDCNTSYNFQDYLKSTKTDFGFRTNFTLGIAL
ncbi:hypothetical protein [Dyadobacter fermentans]|uniref:Outer membrane protein beta-barrel domain-containing protein n=1 Tax=Dyadobacter fermentans (strain ATCC 700827 / DSM 18053 / CIP 107007 / KCTC 52180 / NS114) TaxID=471854 RepID=C6W691_DYAFD|nr:hypothetical protein [Dyadobacter fermentans]ACT92571.1 hypothetical protein Dfer_1323 [Dyadobacter fermentans DSM 18053]